MDCLKRLNSCHRACVLSGLAVESRQAGRGWKSLYETTDPNSPSATSVRIWSRFYSFNGFNDSPVRRARDAVAALERGFRAEQLQFRADLSQAVLSVLPDAGPSRLEPPFVRHRVAGASSATRDCGLRSLNFSPAVSMRARWPSSTTPVAWARRWPQIVHLLLVLANDLRWTTEDVAGRQIREPSAAPRPDAAADLLQPRLTLGELPQEFFFRLYDQFRGGARRRRAQVGDKIGDGEINLVADGGDGRNS